MQDKIRYKDIKDELSKKYFFDFRSNLIDLYDFINQFRNF